MSEPNENADSSDGIPVNPLECMPIFKRFTRETLEAMAAQSWKSFDRPMSDGTPSVTNRRAVITLSIPEIGLINEPDKVCPIAFCLWKEGKAWTTRRESIYDESKDEEINPLESAFEGAPDADDAAKQYIGVSYEEGYKGEIPPESSDLYEQVKREADEFIEQWDSGKIIDLARAACLHQPA